MAAAAPDLMKPSPPHTTPDANPIVHRPAGETFDPPTARRSIAAVGVVYVLALNLHQRHSRRLEFHGPLYMPIGGRACESSPAVFAHMAGITLLANGRCPLLSMFKRIPGIDVRK